MLFGGVGKSPCVPVDPGGEMAPLFWFGRRNHACLQVSTTRGLNASVAGKQRLPPSHAKEWISGKARAYDMAPALESDGAEIRRAAHPAMIRRLALHDPIRRGVALVIAMSFHLVVLILMAWPTIHKRSAAPVEGRRLHAIQIRFFRPPSAHKTASAPGGIAPALRVRTVLSAQPPKPPTVQYATRAAPLPAEKHSPGSPAASTPLAGNESAIGDGGFRERLLEAQRSHAVRGIPGSDQPWVAGIPLIDPRTQGIAAVMRRAQRLFGIANRHCIDVDVWRHLTPQELIAQHVSPGEVARTDATYHCNRPPGLSF